jgi:hypothetical protein
MAKWPNWKQLKQSLDDPAQREEMREKLQTGLERGRDSATQRLRGPAGHLRNVGAQFKAGLTEPDPEPGVTPTAEPEVGPDSSAPPARPEF